MNKSFLVIFLFSRLVYGAGMEDLPFQTASSIPPDALETFRHHAPANNYIFSAHVNPFYIQGDMNGDGRLDTAILIKEKSSQKTGIAIIHGGLKTAMIAGAGREFGNGGDDFSWMDAWYIYPKGTVAQGADAGPPPRLTGDAIMVIKTESASALIYWTGNGYAWYQQGD